MSEKKNLQLFFFKMATVDNHFIVCGRLFHACGLAKAKARLLNSDRGFDTTRLPADEELGRLLTIAKTVKSHKFDREINIIYYLDIHVLKPSTLVHMQQFHSDRLRNAISRIHECFLCTAIHHADKNLTLERCKKNIVPFFNGAVETYGISAAGFAITENLTILNHGSSGRTSDRHS